MTVIATVANVIFMQSIYSTNELVGSCFTAVSFETTALFLSIMRPHILMLYLLVVRATGV